MAPSGNVLIAGISAGYLASTMGYVDTLRNVFSPKVRRAVNGIYIVRMLIFDNSSV
jgi:hypothetical protein